MSWYRMEGQWKQGREDAIHNSGTAMHGKLAAIAGKYKEFVGRLQGKYGISKEEAQVRADELKKPGDSGRANRSENTAKEKAHK